MTGRANTVRDGRGGARRGGDTPGAARLRETAAAPGGWQSGAKSGRIGLPGSVGGAGGEDQVERRLSAMLCADVAGYSGMMAADEEGTLARLQDCQRDIVEPAVAGHHGRVVKEMGDGFLAEFPSVVNAVRGAVALQTSMEAHNDGSEDAIRFRIGVNLGDIIVKGDDIFGDSVNVAARLEALAEPGGIVLSGDAWRHVKGKVSVECESLGELELKNLPEPVPAFRVKFDTQGADRAFFESQVLGQMDRLYGMALRMTRNPATAEDLVAETVTRAWAGFATLNDRSRLRPWLFRILTNTFISQYRKQATDPTVEEWVEGCGEDDADFSLFERLHQPFLLWWGNPEQEFVNKLLRQDIAAAIDGLPEPFRLAVMLVDVEGFSYQEAAEALDVPVGTVRSRLKRARACLQKALWQHAGDIGAAGENGEGVPG
jgi:RNA polymerase sigma-70 factor (ECF subfamily)